METDSDISPPPSDSLSTTWLLVGTLAGLFVVHQLHTYTYLWRKGIKGPVPLPLAGNYMSMLFGLLPAWKNWHEKYGSTFGMYQGKTPTIVVSDVELARLITTKEFSSFQALDNGTFQMKYMKDTLVAHSGPTWKRIRSYMTPTFSASKLKLLIPAINDRCDVMMEVMGKKQINREGFETKLILMPYVLDCIARCAFGVEANCQTDPADLFVKHSKLLQEDLDSRPGTILGAMFPSLQPFFTFIGLEMFPEKSMDFFANIVKRAVDMRKEGASSERKDFLQLMINAAETGGDEEPSIQNGVTTKKKIPLTTDELVAQSLIFFFAGFDTVATSTGFALYALATNPEIQAKLHEEIDEMIPEGELIGYDVFPKMEYLDKVWNEALRMYPVAIALSRYCNKDFSHKGVNINTGDFIFINIWDIHRDAEHWPEPHKFDPERFDKNNKDQSRHPAAFMPFGAGPRNCVGMRLAVIQSKMALIRILQKYTIEVMPETPDFNDLKSFGTTGSPYPNKGIHLRHMPRK